MRQAARILVLISAVLGGVLSPGCSKKADEAAAPPASGGSQVASVQAKYASAIDAFPSDPESANVFRLLCDAAVKDGWAKSLAEAPEALIAHFPGENIGLFAFETRYAELKDRSATERSEFCKKVRGESGDSPVAALALDEALKIVRDTDAPKFLEECVKQLGETGKGRFARVVLARRAEFYRESGKPKEAALDYLRLWSENPEKMHPLGLDASAIACLRESEFALEADLLQRSPKPEDYATKLLKEFTRSADSSSSGSAAAYYRFAPDQGKIAEKEAVSGASPEGALANARLARLAVLNRDERGAANYFRGYCSQLRELIAGNRIDFQAYDSIAPVGVVVLASAQSMFGSDEMVREIKRGRSNPVSVLEAQSILGLLQGAGKDLAEAGMNSAVQAGDKAFAGTIRTVASNRVAAGDPKAPAALYERFVAQYPDSELAPGFLFDAAETYEKAAKAPAKAGELMGTLCEKYPNSPLAAEAKIKQGLYLYEAERFADALLALQEFTAAAGKDDNRMAVAKFFSALCESALDLKAESETHMTELVRDYPSSELAPRALFWMGSNLFSRQDYPGALARFDELVSRFPESEYSKQASTYSAQLAKLQKK